eukprot:scaffold9765_cov137-Skeletonema_dohrnii-CCMP3373.AAC.3
MIMYSHNSLDETLAKIMMFTTCLFLAARISFDGDAVIDEFKHYSIGIPEPLFDQTRRLRKNTPAIYDSYSFDEIYNHFECKAYAADKSSRPVPSLEQWLFLRKQYKEFVDETASFDDVVSPTLGYAFGNTDEPPPFYAMKSPGKERSLYASRDIKQGEIVHDTAASETLFPDIYAYRRFILSLPKNMICDVMDWAWTRKLNENGPDYVCLGINISSLIRTADKELDANVRPETNISSIFYATRDIQQDEEILTHFIRLSAE